MGSPTMVLDFNQDIPEATAQDLTAAFNHAVSFYLKVSGEEFLRRLDAHELEMEDPLVVKVLRRLEFVRPTERVH